MRILATTTLFLVFMLIPYSISAQAKQDIPKVQLSSIQKVYVGGMGSSDTAERFRLLLKQQLSEAGFTLVGKPEKADALIVGILSLPINVLYSSEADVSLVLEATTLDGEQLWFANYANFRFSYSRDPLKSGAQRVADKLRTDFGKPEKSSSTNSK